MRNGQLVLVACKIQGGAFSGERVVRFPMADEQGEYVGISPVDHCFEKSMVPLAQNQPPAGTEIDGYVEAYLIENGGDRARIELPDGEAIRVAVSQVAFYQKESDRGSRYVPVGS